VDSSKRRAAPFWLKEQLGHRDVLDLSALETARAAELALVLWIRVRMVVGHDHFNFKIAR
jgi:hypothetical protein